MKKAIMLSAQRRKEACITFTMVIILLMLSVGMDVVIHSHLAFTILNLLQVVYINRRQCIKLLKPTILLCAVLCRASSIIIRKVFPHLTITATSIVMK